MDAERICLNCRHWQGDRAKMLKAMKEHPRAISEDKGWPEHGRCSQGYRLDLEVDCGTYCQGGSAVLVVPAWFGCVMFEALGEAGAAPGKVRSDQ